MTKEKRHHMIEAERTRAIIIMIVCSVLFAVAAGAALALIDTGQGIGDLVSAFQIKNEERAEQPEEQTEALMVLDQKVLDKVGMGEEESTETKQEVAKTAETTPAPTFSENTVSENTVSENTVSGNTVSENTVDTAAVSGDQMPADTTAQTVSENAASQPLTGDAAQVLPTDPAAAEAVTTAIPAATNAILPYPMGMGLVDASYFNDALFIGDSRMEGFGMHSGLNATFYAATGLQLHKIDTQKVVRTANGKVPIFTVLQPNLYKKVYIKVGLNELGWGTDEKFLQEYADLIARIRAVEPGAIIYVHGLIHVTSAKSQTDSVHTNEKINARNAMLQQFALQQQAYYVDINEVVSDADGALIPDMTSDGIHLKAQYMEVWKNYLMSHAVIIP